MKDLLVYVADADAEAFLRSILNKPQALDVRPFTFEIMRHPQRDGGMVSSGAELACMQKNKFSKALLLWDHHGSGRDHRQNANVVAAEIQEKLDRRTWSGSSAVIIFVPELEQWLWYCESALADYCEISTSELHSWLQEYATKHKKSLQQIKGEQPKELFEYVIKQKLRHSISPRIFEEIGAKASIKGLKDCSSFFEVRQKLSHWFPHPDCEK